MKSPVGPESATIASARRSASIIAFPTRTVPVVASPEDRMARSLHALNAAMQEQRTAVAAWRDALSRLKETTGGLETSLQRYQTNLKSLSGSVSALHAKARALEQWADRATHEA